MATKNDGYEYVRENYGVPVKVGQRIVVNGKAGTVRKPDPAKSPYVRYRQDGENFRRLAHPTWETVYYAEDGTTILADYQAQQQKEETA